MMNQSRACIIIWGEAQANELRAALTRRSWRVVVLKPALPVFTPLSDTADVVVVDADVQSAYASVLHEVNPAKTDLIALSKRATTSHLMKLADQNVSIFVEKPIDVELLAEAITASSVKSGIRSSETPRVLTSKQASCDGSYDHRKDGT